jgi:alpha-glucosidase
LLRKVPTLARLHLCMHRRLVPTVAAALLLVGVLAVPAPAAKPNALTLSLRDGTTLRVDASPFRFSITDAAGHVRVSSVVGREGAPVRVPGLDGPEPVEPLGSQGGFPALGFVVGAAPALSYPLPLFTGNRLFGAEAGALVSLVEVTGSHRTNTGLEMDVRTDAPSLGPATLLMSALPGGGVSLDLRPPAGITPVSSVFTLATPRAEGLYGLGGRKDAFDQRGLLRNVWTEEQNTGDERVEPASCPTVGCSYTFPNGGQAAYLVQPSVTGSRGWTAWVAQTELSRVDLAASRPDALRWGVASPHLRLRLAAGGFQRSLQAHVNAVGRAPAPPAWIYRPWVDVINEGEGEAAPDGGGFTGGARVKADLERITQEAKAKGLPLGVLGVEGWQSVPDGPRFFAQLRRQGYHLSAYWNPFMSPGNAAYDEALAKGLLIKDATGQPYAFVNNRGSRTYALDFTARGTQAFWDHQLARSMSLGFEGWMHDFGEFVTEGMRFADGTPPEVMHNRYPVLLHNAAAHAAATYAAGHPGFSPFFYVRSGYDGVQRSTGGVFPGDETTDWSTGSGLPSVVPAMLNLAVGGFPTFSTDVGGYFDFLAPRTTPELLVRWAQLAALSPVMRTHNSTQKKSLYPSDLTGPALDAYRRYARAKVALAPLVDRLTHTGTGPIRPLVLDDPAAVSIGDEWLLGADLLVAPVLKQGATSRSVYLPHGAAWQQVRVDESGSFVNVRAPVPGGQHVSVPVTLADIPLFVRRDQTRAPSPTTPRATQYHTAGGLPTTGGTGPALVGAALLLLTMGLRRSRANCRRAHR